MIKYERIDLMQPPLSRHSKIYQPITQTQKYSLIIFLYLFYLLTACQTVSWSSIPPQVSQTALANDHSDMVVVMQNYEINETAKKDPNNIFAATRNFEHQLFVQSPQGENKTAITPKRAGKDVSGTLHYLKPAGYILLGISAAEGKNKLRYEKINLQTGQATLIRHHSGIRPYQLCQNTQPAFLIETVLPSPDGKQIVYVHTPHCAQAVIEFLRADDLTLLERKKVKIQGINEASWSKEEGFVLHPLLSSKNHAVH